MYKFPGHIVLNTTGIQINICFAVLHVLHQVWHCKSCQTSNSVDSQYRERKELVLCLVKSGLGSEDGQS